MDDATLWAFEVAGKEANRLKHDLGKLPDGIRQVYFVLILNADASMSGIEMWLERSYANWAPETVAALREIGAHRSAEVVSRALSVFPGGTPPRDSEEREDLMQVLLLPKRFWDELTDEYHSAATEDGVDALVSAYVHEHAEIFRLDEMTPRPPLPPPSEPSAEGLEVIAAMERAAERQRAKRN